MNQDQKSLDEQIERMMERLTIEKAPPTLSARLHRIPEEEGRKAHQKASRRAWLGSGRFPRWVLAPAFAAVPLALLVVMMMQPRQPSRAEVEQARQDLAVAFSYIDRVGLLTGNEIQSVLGAELRHSVKAPLSEHIPFTEQSHKEEST